MFQTRPVLLFALCSIMFFAFMGLPAEGNVRGAIQAAGQESMPSMSPGQDIDLREAASIEMSPGQINARSAVLLEVSTGAVIFEQNADEPIEPASFTKILTLYLVNEALQQGVAHLDDSVYISEKAWRTGGSKMFVGVGTRVPLQEIIKGIAVVSGNDACVAAAEHLAGSVDAFVDAMNRKSRELGMGRTRFINPHGLPAEGQITTARDMAKMDMSYLRRFPEFLHFHSIQEYTYNDITQHNRNRLLRRDPSVDGLKTGYVSAAGYHLAATASRDGMRLLAVVMGASNPAVREREAMKLLNFGFRFYTLVTPFPEGKPVASLRVWKGEKDEVDLFPDDVPSFLISQAGKNLLRWEINAPTNVTAPLPARSLLGEMIFYVSDVPQKTVPLVNHDELVQAGLFKRVWQTLLRLVQVDWKTLAYIVGGVLFLGGLLFVVLSRKSVRKPKTFSKR